MDLLAIMSVEKDLKIDWKYTMNIWSIIIDLLDGNNYINNNDKVQIYKEKEIKNTADADYLVLFGTLNVLNKSN